MVSEETEEYLVDMVRKSRQAQFVSEGLACLDKQRRWGERIPHVGSEYSID